MNPGTNAGTSSGINLVTLVNEEPVMLASGKLVYSADETGALQSAVDAAASLASACASADERITAATEAGRQQGMSEGYEAGLQEGRRQISAELVRLAEASQLHIAQQRRHSTEMALQIVRKVTGTLAPDETLAALAAVAADEVAQDEKITLRVHPDYCDAVRQRLVEGEQGSDAAGSGITTVLADASLEPQGCVLETRHGSVIADLETQLRAIQNSLPDDFTDSVAEQA